MSTTDSRTDLQYWLDVTEQARSQFRDHFSIELVQELHEALTARLGAIARSLDRQSIKRCHALVRATAAALDDLA